MRFLQTFQVFPSIPESISFLQVLARNLWWCWHIDAIELFRRISPRIWEDSGRNPIVFLTLIPQERLKELSKDESFLAHQQRVEERFVNDLASEDSSEASNGKKGTIAYFSMEFGIHESVPLFAGGLGVLAGDHLKAASDLTLPLIGVGLLYRYGYFHQFLDHEGWQQEEYPETDIYRLPVKRVKDRSGNELNISVTGPEGEIRALVWEIMVGRIPLILLDTNLPENSPQIREITSRLYAGTPKTRLAQEVLLGIGGMRALEAMGIYPTVCHMNEGHCAFVTLERLAQTMSSYRVNLETAKEIVSRTTVFTTHTPVAAGHDEFPVELVKPYFNSFTSRLGTTPNTSTGSADSTDRWHATCGPMSGPAGRKMRFPLPILQTAYIFLRGFPLRTPCCLNAISDRIGIWTWGTRKLPNALTIFMMRNCGDPEK